MSKRRTYSGLLALGATAALLAGCSADGSATDTSAADAHVTGALADLYAAAKKEGKVTVYENASPDAVAALAEGFEKTYPGIKVEAVRLPDAQMIPRLETELSSGAPTADFIENASPGWLIAQGAKGAWVASDAPQAGGKGSYDAAKYFDAKNKVYEVGGSVTTFAWNTELVPDGIKDYPDLADPKFGGGKVGVLELASAPGAVYYGWLEKTFGTTFYDTLGAQKPRIYPSTTDIVQALGSGEIYATNWVVPSLLEQAKADGAPVAYAMSPTGTFGLHGYGVINAKAKNPNAAKLYLEYVLSPEGQAQIWALGASVVSPPPEGVLTTNDKLPPWDPAQETTQKLEAARASWDATYR
jgi:iron(III) transport system substrate-binding protein